MRALVTDVHLRTAVAGIRALGRGGVEVVALGSRPGAAGGRSRYASTRVTGPDAVEDPDGFRAAVVRLAELHGPAVLYPCQEASLDGVLDAAESSDAVRLPWPGRGPLAALRDKSALPEAARAAGLATPAVHHAGPAASLDANAIPYPSLAKPAAPGGALARPVTLGSPADARALPAADVIVQELGHEPLSAVVALVAPDGELVASMQQQALRTWPPGAGPSALAVTVPPDPVLIEGCHALLRAAGYWGLAELQFVSTGRGPALIDVNTRFYGSLPLALRAGINFPAAWHALAQGDRPVVPAGYRTGVGFRWLEADLSEAARGRVGALSPAGPRPRAGAFWAADDPVPAALLAADAIRVRVGRRL